MSEKENVVSVDLSDISSLRLGIEKFRSCFNQDDVKLGWQDEYESIFRIEEDGEQRSFNLKDAINVSRVREIMELGESCMPNSEDDSPYYDHRFCDAVFFVAALEHKELKDDIIVLAKEIVNFSISKNDTDSLWLDDFHVFGLDILMAVGLYYPEYIYLISLYIIPYWDDEHAPYAMTYLPLFVEKNGLNNNTLKAIAYCNNSYTVSEMCFGESPIDICMIDFFKNNPSSYTYFCDEYIEHKKNYPISIEDSEGMHIVELFFRSICSADDYEALLSVSFVNDSLENDIADFIIRVNKAMKDIPKSSFYFNN